MLQTLLGERLQVGVHFETRTLPVLALSLGKEAPKVHKSGAAGAGTLKPGGGRIVAQHLSMPEFAAVLSDPLRSPVVDQTGLPGRYDFTLDYSSSAPEPGREPDERSETITLVHQQLGLLLESRKLPIPILIVDRAERIPTPN